MRALIALAVVLTATAADLSAKDIRDSVVKIYNTRRRPDMLRPWTKGRPSELSGSGVVISGNRILTNAHVVLYSQRLYVQSHQSSDRIAAKVVAISPEMDLAVITADPSFFKDRPTLELAAKLPNIKDTINAYGFPIGGQQMSVTEGIVSRIEYAGYYYASAGLRIQVDAALNPGNSGGPAIANGKIAGLVFSRVGNADNIGYIIPAEEVRDFLADIKDGKFDGKPKLFDYLQTVENPGLRARLKLSSQTGGLMIKSIHSGAAADYPLKRFDVITHIGKTPLDNRGNVKVNNDLRLSFRYLIAKVAKNGKVDLTIFRDGKSMRVKAPVSNNRKWLVPWLKGKYPRHFIVGPMVFMPGSQDLLEMLGARGAVALSAKRNPLITRRSTIKSFDGEELVVLGARLFSHPLSQGYSPQVFGVVTKVNGKKVKNLNHLVASIRDAKGKFLQIDIAGNYETLIFPRQELIDSTDQILEDEGIRKQFSSDLGKIWEKE